MYIYSISLEHHHVDYYTDEQTILPVDVYTFIDASVWEARFRARLFLFERLKKLTIVDSYQVEITLGTKGQENPCALGSWFLRYPPKNPFQDWNWVAEAHFLEQQQAYRQGDKELIVLEQTLQAEKITEFEQKYASTLPTYRKELGILHLLVENFEQAFDYFAVEASYTFRIILHNIAAKLAYGSGKVDYTYMKKYDKLYPTGRPFLE